MYQCDGQASHQYFPSSHHQTFAAPSAESSGYWERGYSNSTPSAASSSDGWGGSYSNRSESSSSSSGSLGRQIVGVSCVVVSIGTTSTVYGQRSLPMVARATVVDINGNTLLDTYVRPTYHVTDYRASFTGLNYAHLQGAPSFAQVQEEVSRLIQNNIIVGHRIWDFLSAMGLNHPAIDTRDMALYRPLRKRMKSKYILDLRTLVRWFLGKEPIDTFENSLESSILSMELYLAFQTQFEAVINTGAWPCDLPPIAFARHLL